MFFYYFLLCGKISVWLLKKKKKNNLKYILLLKYFKVIFKIYWVKNKNIKIIVSNILVII